MGIKNLFKSKKQKLIDNLQEKQPLPLGVTDFHKWSDRIINAAMIGADRESQKFALADMILHLSATDDHKEDAYFIKVLRKTAVNQVADFMRKDIRDSVKARMEAEEKAKAQAKSDAEAALENEYVPVDPSCDTQEMVNEPEKQTI